MRGSFRIARLMGIDIMVDLSWFIIVILLVYSLGFVEFPRALHPSRFSARADVMSIALGIAASLLLFASILAHELSHSWMALQRGIGVKRITLFIFGGVAQIADEPDRPSTEFLIAIMGPLMSAALAAVFGSAWLWLQIADNARVVRVSLTPLILLCGILAQTNGSLALFNLAPGFPLDGGRVLRAILWGASHNLRRATWWAARTGQVIAILLIAFGGWQFFSEFNSSGIWYALIGFFLWSAAGDGYRQSIVTATLRDVTVGQLMTRVYETVSPEISISEFVEQHLLPHREQTFAVMDGTRLAGLIALTHIKRLRRNEWTVRRVRDVMTPRDRWTVLTPTQNAATALARMSLTEADELPVMNDDALIGFLGENELARYLKLNTDAKRR